MKKLAVAALTALALTGCASPSEVAAEDQVQEVSANEDACKSFADNTSRIADPFDESNGNAKDLWDTLREDFDKDALAAEGDVKVRIQALVDELPTVGEIYVYEEARSETNELINAVSRACEADNSPVSVSTYSG